jgi:hypothetical protein
MTTATQAPKARKPVTRTATVTRIGDAVILWLTVGSDTTAYRVTAIPHGFGKAAFRLDKADKGDCNPESYNVLLDGQHSLCDCLGFEKHGLCKDGRGCKHIAGLTAALAAKLLPVPESKPQPVMVNAEEPIATALLGGERHRQEMAARQVSDCCFNCGRPYSECTCTI